MFVVVFIILAGLGFGFIYRNRNLVYLPVCTRLLIYILLFVLGVESGENPVLRESVSVIGRDALLIGLASTMGSVLLGGGVFRIFYPEINRAASRSLNSGSSLLRAFKGSMFILFFFIGGIICGYNGLFSRFSLPAEISVYILWVLMFFVGAGIGSDRRILPTFKNVRPKILLLPAATLGGSFIASFLIGFLIPGRTSTDCLAVGAGMGYYSLSSVFITGYKGAELGAVALVSNIIREMFTLVFAPLLAYCFGKFAPIAAGGATTADTTLPVIVQVSGKDMVFISLLNGLLTDLSVPFTITFFCSL